MKLMKYRWLSWKVSWRILKHLCRLSRNMQSLGNADSAYTSGCLTCKPYITLCNNFCKWDSCWPAQSFNTVLKSVPMYLRILKPFYCSVSLLSVAWCRPRMKISDLSPTASVEERACVVRAWWRYGCEVCPTWTKFLLSMGKYVLFFHSNNFSCICIYTMELFWHAKKIAHFSYKCGFFQAVKIISVRPGGDSSTLRIDPTYLRKRLHFSWFGEIIFIVFISLVSRCFISWTIDI